MNYNLLNNELLSELEQTKDLIVSWQFFELNSYCMNIKDIDNINNIDKNTKKYKITVDDKYKKYKHKLIHFIQYDKNIVKTYKRNKQIPLSKEYFKKIATTLLKDEKLKIYNFKTFPIFFIKNLVIIGIIFLNNNKICNINYNIVYKKIFIVDSNKTYTRFNNINIIKGIINTSINKEYLDDEIILINNCETILSKNLNTNCSLLYLLNIIQKYSWIFEFKI